MKKVVTFDFDDTLCMKDGSPNEEMLKLVHKHAQEGKKCYIVTARNKDHESKTWWNDNEPGRTPVKEFVKRHGLPIKQCHFTNHNLKGPTLKRLGSTLHYDDKEEELQSAKDHGIEAVQSLKPKK